MSNIKIAIVKSNVFHKGGCEKYTLRLAQAFAEKGAEVSLVTSELQTERHLEVFSVVNLGKPSAISYLHLRQHDKRCQQWIKDNSPDIVFGMDRNTYQTHYRAGNGVHAEYLQKRACTDSWLKVHSFKLNPLHRRILAIERKTYQSPHLRVLFTNSQMVRNEIVKHYRTDPSKIQVVHNGVEWYEMQTAFDLWSDVKMNVCLELGLKSECFQFLFIGNGYRRKGLQYLLEALSLLNKSDFQLSIVGKDKEIKDFQALAVKLNLENSVKFFGPQENLENFYQIADALVIPSIYDPFANVTVEALAMGLFVVSSEFNGGSEVLGQENGTIIENLFNPDSLAQSLKHAMKHHKTSHSSRFIRNSVQHLDFSRQLDAIVTQTLNSIQVPVFSD